MPSFSDTVECPACSREFTVERLSVAAHGVCPICGQPFELPGASGPPVLREVSVFEDLPEMWVHPTTVHRPKASLFGSFVRRPADAIRRRSKLIVHGSVATALLLAFAVTGVFAYSNRNKLPLESMQTFLLNEDSPQEVLESYVRLSDRMIDEISSIQDSKSRRRALPGLLGGIDGCQKLAARAVALGPMSADEFANYQDVFERQLPGLATRVTGVAKTAYSDRTISSPELQPALHEATKVFDRLNATIQTAWRPVPIPESDADQLAFEIKQIRLRAWGAAASVTNQSEYLLLNDTLESAASEMESVLGRLVAIKEGDGQALSDLYDDDLLADLQSQVKRLRQKYGDRADDAALQRLVAAAIALGSRSH